MYTLRKEKSRTKTGGVRVPIAIMILAALIIVSLIFLLVLSDPIHKRVSKLEGDLYRKSSAALKTIDRICIVILALSFAIPIAIYITASLIYGRIHKNSRETTQKPDF